MKYYEVTDSSSLLCGECPVWDWRENVLYYTDTSAGILFRYDPAKKERRKICERENISGVGLNKNGGFLCASGQGVFSWKEEEGWRLIAAEHEGKALHCNDAVADPNGRFLFGTTFISFAGEFDRGYLYAMEKGGTLRVLDEGWGLPNGMAFSPDGRILYAVDSYERAVYALDYDPETGKASNKRKIVDIPWNEGMPDGITVDAEGCLWLAQFFGYTVVRYSPEGEVLLKLPVPCGQVSSVMFGGEYLTDIYVTTSSVPARMPLAPKGFDFDAPLSGNTYCYNIGIQGVREYIADI